MIFLFYQEFIWKRQNLERFLSLTGLRIQGKGYYRSFTFNAALPRIFSISAVAFQSLPLPRQHSPYSSYLRPSSCSTCVPCEYSNCKIGRLSLTPINVDVPNLTPSTKTAKKKTKSVSRSRTHLNPHHISHISIRDHDRPRRCAASRNC